jgi:hypothetical protein
VREIVVTIPSGSGRGVEVQIIEQNGSVHVTVRTNNNELNATLRGELSDLVRVLEEKGLKAETWTPADTYPSSNANELKASTSQSQNNYGSGAGSQGEGGGGNRGGSQQQQKQEEQNQSRRDWLLELERRLEKGE